MAFGGSEVNGEVLEWTSPLFSFWSCLQYDNYGLSGEVTLVAKLIVRTYSAESLTWQVAQSQTEASAVFSTNSRCNTGSLISAPQVALRWLFLIPNLRAILVPLSCAVLNEMLLE